MPPRADHQQGAPVQRDRRHAAAAAIPSTALFLAQVEAQVAGQHQQHREHMLGDGRSMRTLHVGQHDVRRGAQLLQTQVALHPGARRLHPHQVGGRAQELGRAVTAVDAVGLRCQGQGFLPRPGHEDAQVGRGALQLGELLRREPAGEEGQLARAAGGVGRHPCMAQRAQRLRGGVLGRLRAAEDQGRNTAKKREEAHAASLLRPQQAAAVLRRPPSSRLSGR